MVPFNLQSTYKCQHHVQFNTTEQTPSTLMDRVFCSLHWEEKVKKFPDRLALSGSVRDALWGLVVVLALVTQCLYTRAPLVAQN